LVLPVFRNKHLTMKTIVTFILSFTLSVVMAQQNEITRRALQPALMDQKVKTVEIQEISFPAGQTAPKHLHPCPVVGYIKSGTVLFQIEGQDSVILKEGDSFYEPKNTIILHFDNASTDKPVTFVAFYLKEGNEANMKLIR
jgi:quercetin dioxygenase-like cupin family protein